MVANILPTDPLAPTTQGMGSIGQNSTFSEHGHVAYQFKGNQEMQPHGSNYFNRRPPSPYDPIGIGQKVKIQVSEPGLLHINLKVTRNAATW